MVMGKCSGLENCGFPTCACVHLFYLGYKMFILNNSSYLSGISDDRVIRYTGSK